MWLKDEERGYCGWEFEVHRHFSFPIATLQLFPHPENVKISILPFTLSRQKCHIFKSTKRIFKNLFLAERWGRWILWLKISSAQRFWFCNSNVTTFPTSRKCKKFNFLLYTVAAEILYLQKYLTNFQKLFFGWSAQKKIWSAQRFRFCNSNVTTFPTSRKCKNFNFALYTVLAENLYLQKYLTNFQRIFGCKMRNVAIVVKNLKCTDILVLQ